MLEDMMENMNPSLPPLDNYVGKRNPEEMEPEIRMELRRYMDNGPATLLELAEEDDEAVVYILDRKVDDRRELISKKGEKHGKGSCGDQEPQAGTDRPCVGGQSPAHRIVLWAI